MTTRASVNNTRKSNKKPTKCLTFAGAKTKKPINNVA